MNENIVGGSPDKEQATKIELRVGSTLEDAVNQLIDHRELGETVFCVFNGHKLFSDDVTMDSAFLEVTGKNKADFDKANEEWLANSIRETEEASRKAEAKIPGWIEMGKTLGIDPALSKDWEKMVKIRAGDIYHGREIDDAIAIMQKINDGATAKDIKEALAEQGHSGASYGMVRSIVETFSPRGKDIYNEIKKLEATR